MSNVRIKDLATDSALAAGDYIIVDSEAEGTRKYDIGSGLAGKVNKPAGNGTSGQVLKTNGDGTTIWANESSGSSVTVDTSLSASSENPVQNKVIYSALEDKQDLLSIDYLPTQNSMNPVSSGGVHEVLQDKADAVNIKQRTASVTSMTLTANVFNIWPEMSALTINCPATGGPYAFRFTSGSTPTTLTMTGITMPNDFTVEANKVYEINVYHGYGLAASWEVS